MRSLEKKVDFREKHKDTSESSCGEKLTSIIHSQNEVWYKEWVLMTAEESFKKKKKKRFGLKATRGGHLVQMPFPHKANFTLDFEIQSLVHSRFNVD